MSAVDRLREMQEQAERAEERAACKAGIHYWVLAETLEDGRSRDKCRRCGAESVRDPGLRGRRKVVKTP